MPPLLALYLDYLRSAVLVMVWAACTLAVYGFIRSSTAAEITVAAAVSLVLPLAVTLLAAGLLSPSRSPRGVMGVIAAPVLAWLRKARLHPRRNHDT
jgi:hypothetical protein